PDGPPPAAPAAPPRPAGPVPAAPRRRRRSWGPGFGPRPDPASPPPVLGSSLVLPAYVPPGPGAAIRALTVVGSAAPLELVGGGDGPGAQGGGHVAGGEEPGVRLW